MKIPALIFSLSLLCTACGGGGGGASTTPPAPIAQPPVFESPHPATWETQSAADAGFDTAALEAAFGYAMADGSFTQAALVVKAGKLVDERYRGIAEGEV
ncbi:penicillin-binding protein, partial [Luminiphilus sp.]|nr:penicillin-binding protein [Luminiphilus sp.]